MVRRVVAVACPGIKWNAISKIITNTKRAGGVASVLRVPV
jgi:hypothetical protein